MTDRRRSDRSRTGHSGRSERLLLDAMLGKLATYLRMCGYDAAYVLERDDDGSARPDTDPGDDGIAERARASGRTLLTRDSDLAARVEGAVLLRSKDVREQLAELGEAGFALSLSDRPRRCAACNGELLPVGDDERVPSYAPDPAETACWRCRDCGQVFWTGSHWDDVAATVEEVG